MAGDDLLRSKDMDTDSYDSGDWFNKIDWTGESNNWGIGLPIASKNRDQYGVEKPLLSNASLKPDANTIKQTSSVFGEFLKIRYSSPLFRLRSAEEVQIHLRFLNTGPEQIPGVIAFELDSTDDTDGPYKHVLVVCNATTATQKISSPSLKGLDLKLHPVQAQSSDAIVRRAIFASAAGTAEVPPLTTAVFVAP